MQRQIFRTVTVKIFNMPRKEKIYGLKQTSSTCWVTVVYKEQILYQETSAAFESPVFRCAKQYPLYKNEMTSILHGKDLFLNKMSLKDKRFQIQESRLDLNNFYISVFKYYSGFECHGNRENIWGISRLYLKHEFKNKQQKRQDLSYHIVTMTSSLPVKDKVDLNYVLNNLWTYRKKYFYKPKRAVEGKRLKH